VRLPGPTHHVIGFQYLADADRFLIEFRERLLKFGLELHPDKTRRIEFGRFAERAGNREAKGNPGRLTFWDSRTPAERTGMGAML
jgi:RNA-directed DNA polymerase